MGIRRATGGNLRKASGGGGVRGALVAYAPPGAAFTHGQPFTIAGSGFGTKSTAAPLKWDTFAGGVDGEVVDNGWYVTATSGGFTTPRYATDILRTGRTRSVKQDFTTAEKYNCTIGMTGLSTPSLFVSFWKYSTFSGGLCRNWKLVACRGGSAGDWELPNGRHDVYPDTSSGHIYLADIDGTVRGNNYTDGYSATASTWERYEYWVDFGTPGVSDAAFIWWLDGKKMANSTGFLGSASALNLFTNLYVNAYFARDTNAAASYHWLSDIFVDATPQRVELSTASTWTEASAMPREVQPATAWDDDEITITANHGAFGAGTAYLYVIGADGAPISTAGLAVTLPS